MITKKNETRAVYFSYIEFANYITDKSDEEQKKNIRMVLDNIKSLNLNTIIVHVRAFSDSIYKSDYYPYSKYILNDNGEIPSYDILDFFIKEAHKRKIKFEAWINPYRISNTTDLSKLSSDSVFFLHTDSAVTAKGIYLNPASMDVRKRIVNGIAEIVKNYDVDGIHFDDYFYPDKEIDLKSYDEYLDSGGNMSLTDYRLNNVKLLIEDVYSAIKKINKNVLFGIAPEGNIDNCYESYLDVKYILSHEGYIDYIMPQIYFGFLNQSKPFVETLNNWNELIKINSINLIPALAIYKSGKTDKYALSGSKEWMKYSDIIKREIIESRKVSNYTGFSLFSYNYLFNSKYQNDFMNNEISNIKKLLIKNYYLTD